MYFSPVIMAERLSDGIAMLLLAKTGLVLYRFGWELLLLLLVIGLAGIMVIQNRRLSLAILSFGERLPIVARIAHLIRAFYESAYTLLQWRPLLIALPLTVISCSDQTIDLFLLF